MKRIVTILCLALIFLSFGCRRADQEEQGTDPTNPVAVAFLRGAVATPAQTKASGEVLATNTTFRVLVHNAGDDLASATAISERTYRITNEYGNTAMAAVKADGQYDPAGTPADEMMLKSKSYDFYYFAPAIAVTGGQATALANGVDYMALKETYDVKSNNATDSRFHVTEAILQRLCTRLDLSIAPQPGNTVIKTLEIDPLGVTIAGLGVSGLYDFSAPAGGITVTGTNGVLGLAASDFTAPTDGTLKLTTESGRGAIVLPITPAREISITINVKINGKPTVVKAKIAPTQTLAVGSRYLVGIQIDPFGTAGLTGVQVTEIPWEHANSTESGVINPVIGEYRAGGVVYWVDPTDHAKYRVVSLYEPKQMNLADAKLYDYGPEWMLPNTTQAAELASQYAANKAVIDKTLATYMGDPIASQNYWMHTANAANSINLTTGSLATVDGATLQALRVIKEVRPPLVVHPPAASDYVEIDGLKWTKGNLIAVNGNECKVGVPGDYGVYFQFGSLVGWTGGFSGDGTGTGSPALDKAVWPWAMGGSKPGYSWTNNIGTSASDHNTVVDQYFFNYNVAPYATQGRDIRDFAVSFSGDAGTGNLGTGRYAKWGVGDACTYYLGDPWRLPTTAELLALNTAGSGGWTTNGGVTGRWLGTAPGTASSSVFFPASGFRGSSNGAFNTVTEAGYYWSSLVYSTSSGCNLTFYSGGVNPQNDYTRSNGFPVRCVSGTYVPPPPPHSVEINGLYWAEGNLVASNATAGKAGAGGCKIGAPTDGGLYFQFGSLIGYKGGTSGTGVGIPRRGDGSFWDAASSYSWANEAMVWPTEQSGNKTSWSNTTGSSINTLTDYYFNYSLAPWETKEQNIRDFDVLPGTGTGTLGTGRYAALGVGDPCSYYLGDPWRLPTTVELASITGKTGSSWISWTTTGVTGRWATSAQTFGGVSGPGAWFGTGLNAGSGTPSPSANLFFPASGYRHYPTGMFYSVTTYGYYWSSSVYNATYGYSLLVHESTGVIPQNSYIRSGGFPVRCVAPVPVVP